jgi:4-nitrophenyl phosphatase
MSGSNVAAVILAAGGSARFGQPKQLLEWHGRPLITHIADVAWTAGLDPVLVVVGSDAEAVIPRLAERPVQILRNYRWQEGLSSSLNVGVSALPPGTEAAIFLPIDQPLITPRLLQRFVELWRASGAGIIIPHSPEGQRGTPVLFARDFFAALANLSGDIGGRALFEQHAHRIAHLPVADANVLTDADRPEIYQRLLADDDVAGTTFAWSEIRGVICDMDGVLWRGTSALPGIEAFFTLLRELGVDYQLVTNNSSRTPTQYRRKLAEMGVETTEAHILNSSVATARYITELKPGASVYAIGDLGVVEALEAHGVNRVDVDADDAASDLAGQSLPPVDFVVVGWDRALTWRKLAVATRLILEGAAFVATNPDLTFPLETTLAPGNGAQIAALEAATGVKATVIGKPAPLLYRQAMTAMGTTPESTLVIGDRLDTDILGGIRLGMPTALVLTGITHREALADSPIQPTVVLEDLPMLIETWQLRSEDTHA